MATFRDKASPEPAGLGMAGAAKGLISAIASECESLFVQNLQIWNSKYGEDRYELVLRKLEKRFLNWAAYLSVFAQVNESLDQFLEHHPHYHNSILASLDMLNMNLLQTTADHSEPDSDDPDEGVEDIRQILLEGIQQSLKELDRLAIHIRHSHASDLDYRVRMFETKKFAEAYFFNFKAMLTVDCLYPRASEESRRFLSQVMTQKHMKLLYWQYREKASRKDHRFDRKSQGGSTPAPQDSAPLLAKNSAPLTSAIGQKQPILEYKQNNISLSTSILSETLPSDLDSGFTMPAADAEMMPSPRRAGASTILGNRAKLPIPPELEDEEASKPCPLCRKNFSKAEFTDSTWWKCHVNEDLLPFVCIAGPCFQRPAFAYRSEWRAHMQRYHDIFWRRNPAVQIDICPLCRMPPVEPGRPTFDSGDILESSEKNAKADPDEKIATKIEESAEDHMMNLMMNHIADHLQFLALLTVRLSARKITDAEEHSFSSCQATSSDQDYEERSTLNDESEFFEGEASKEKDEHGFLAEVPPDLECPEDEWIESILRNPDQKSETSVTIYRLRKLSYQD